VIPDPPFQPAIFKWLALLLQVASLCCMGVVLLRWSQRRAEGSLPNGGPPFHSWSGMDLTQFLFALLFIYLQVSLVDLAFEKTGLLESDGRKAVFFIGSTIVVYGLFLCLVSHFLRRQGTSWSKAFGLGATGSGNVLLTAMVALMAAAIPVALLGLGTQAVFKMNDWKMEPQPMVDFFLRLDDPWLRAGMAACAVVGAPVFEEILFRGILHPFLKQRLGFAHALWMNSLLFALVHHHAMSLLPLFGLAIVLTLLYEWRRNLAAPIALHAGFNALSLAILLAREYFL